MMTEQLLNLTNYAEVSQNDLIQEYALDENAYIKKAEITTYSSYPSSPDSNKTHSKDNFTVIKNDDYFRNLYEIPYNCDGTCGLVGISMMLGYLQYYYNSGFITNSSYIDGKGTSQDFHDMLFNKYMKTILGIAGSDGYPMAGAEIQSTIKAYLKNETSLSKKVKHEYGRYFIHMLILANSLMRGIQFYW